MVNAHPHIQHRRHPDLAALREYVRQREATLRSIPGERDDAKQLFIRLVYKGHWRKWCQDTGVSPGALPEIVERFRVEQEEISRRDQEANQEILRVLQAEDPGRAAEVLQYVLNTAEERRVMDKVEEALQQMGGRVLAFEHDGLFVYAPCGKEELLERAQAAAGYPLTVKACAEYTTDEA